MHISWQPEAGRDCWRAASAQTLWSQLQVGLETSPLRDALHLPNNLIILISFSRFFISQQEVLRTEGDQCLVR
jgi:hypothetical protein